MSPLDHILDTEKNEIVEKYDDNLAKIKLIDGKIPRDITGIIYELLTGYTYYNSVPSKEIYEEFKGKDYSDCMIGLCKDKEKNAFMIKTIDTDSTYEKRTNEVTVIGRNSSYTYDSTIKKNINTNDLGETSCYIEKGQDIMSDFYFVFETNEDETILEFRKQIEKMIVEIGLSNHTESSNFRIYKIKNKKTSKYYFMVDTYETSFAISPYSYTFYPTSICIKGIRKPIKFQYTNIYVQIDQKRILYSCYLLSGYNKNTASMAGFAGYCPNNPRKNKKMISKYNIYTTLDPKEYPEIINVWKFLNL